MINLDKILIYWKDEIRQLTMPILKPLQKTELKSISAKIPKHLKEEINAYCDFANIAGIQDFIIQASEYVLMKDKEWAKYQKSKNPTIESTDY